MGSSFAVEVLKLDELGAGERSAWRAFRAASDQFESPYFDLRYAEAAGAVAPHARVAVLHRSGRPIGFFAFQRRGGLIQPLGAPLTDYHGVVAAPGERIDAAHLLSTLGARVFRFNGLAPAPALATPAGPKAVPHQRLVADLSGGFDAWMADRQARFSKFYKDKQRTARAIERDLGPLRLEWTREERGVLDYVLALKRDQYRRTRKHDVFACGWTERLLRRLDQAREADFGLAFASLYAGDTLLGAEIGLLSGPVYHLWLPAYDPVHARYGPGMLTTLRTLPLAAQAGITRVDFGRDDAAYKSYFADPAGPVLEGAARKPGLGADLATRGRRLLAGAPRPVAGLPDRVGRRFDIISACETTAWGWCAGALLAFGVVSAAAPPINQVPQARRPHVQRPGSPMVVRTEDGFRQEADRFRAQAG